VGVRAREGIHRRANVRGEEHPDTLTTRRDLARQIGSQGRHSEAEAELRAVFEILRRADVLGEGHPYVLHTRFHLARMLDRMGRSAEADELLLNLRAALTARLHEDHKYVLDLDAYLADRTID